MEITEATEFNFDVTFDRDDLNVGFEVLEVTTGSPVSLGPAAAMSNIPGSFTYFGSFIAPSAGRRFTIVKSVYTDNTLSTKDTSYLAGSDSVTTKTPGAGLSATLLAPSEVMHGKSYNYAGVDYIGTYRGYDIWEKADDDIIAEGVTLLQDGDVITGTAPATPAPTVRSSLDKILLFIGSSSLTDDEFDDLPALTLSSTAEEIYAALFDLLDDRAAMSSIKDRLLFYFRAKGAEVAELEQQPKSQIFLGASL